MQAAAVIDEPKRNRRKIPESLIYEVIDGQPYYRKGYKSVLNRNKTLDDVMGSSTLQAVIIFHLQRLLNGYFNESDFWIFTNESGLHIGKNTNLAGDIFVYDTKSLPPQKIDRHYANVPPLLAIEIDIKTDLEKESDIRYINRKTQKLLDFGVQKVIWIITDAKQVIVAEHGAASHQFMDWNRDVELQPNLTFNIGRYLEKRGIVVD